MSKLPYPPMTDGADLQRFLFRLVDELNNSLNNIGSYAGSSASQVELGGSSSASGSLDDGTVNELKSLIIKNAKDVQTEIEALSKTTDGIENDISQLSIGLEQKIKATDQTVSKHISTTNGYIRQGVVRYDGLTPIIGIAIGQDIAVTGVKVTVNGVEYDTIDTSHNMIVLTSDKLSFYLSGNEVAYFANDSLHVNRISVGDWMIERRNGLSIRWIGGDQ